MSDHLQPHQQRALREYNELRDRLDKLEVFRCSPTHAALPEDERDLLARQARAMHQYAFILSVRIAAFPKRVAA